MAQSTTTDLIWIEINKKALMHNFGVVRKLVGDGVLVALVVKANAYGHGIGGVVSALRKEADWFCVQSAEEALKVKNMAPKSPVLVLGSVVDDDIPKLIKKNVRFLVWTAEQVRSIEFGALRQKSRSSDQPSERAVKKVAICHIKIDTGMSRQGVLPEELDKFIKHLKSLKNIKIEGIATHFSSSDELKNNKAQKNQLEIFENLIKKYPETPLVHASNSGAVLTNRECDFDMVRPGLAIYGYYSSKEVASYCRKQNIELKPSLSFKCRVSGVKNIKKGSRVGYNSTYKVKRDTKIAILPVGYFDGIDRKLSNNGFVLVGGKRAPIIGRVSMNLTIIDVTNIKKVSAGDEVVLIGKQGNEEITVEEWAKRIGTINYEVTTRLRESIHRYYA